MYLNTHSYYSLRYGTLSEKEILSLAASQGCKTIALTDINNTSACINFIRLAPKYGIKPVIGIDVRNGADICFIGIAKNNAGFYELNQFLSHHLHKKIPMPARSPSFEHVFVIYPYDRAPERLAAHEFIGVRLRDLQRYGWKKSRFSLDKYVFLRSLTFRGKKGFNAHRLLRAVDNNTILSKLAKTEEADIEDTLLTREQVQHVRAQYPHLLRNTEALLEECGIRFDLDNPKPKNLKCYSANAIEDMALLKQLSKTGLFYRYGNEITSQIETRLEKELHIIEQKGFVSYFLINWDICKTARERDYYYVGRGSGANSLVAYLLRITDVDPIELDLYFERFINLYRENPPDFDIDFSWLDRDDMTNYIFERFENTALLGVYNTFQFKAVVREIGKVFGLPKHEIDMLSKGRFQFNRLDKLSQLVLKYGHLIKGMPNYLGIHAGGILISEKPINYYTATHMPPKGFPTTHFDMVVAEDVGLHKFDILSQRGLSKIKEAVEIVSKNNPGTVIDIHDIKRLKEDEGIRNILKQGKAIGCFYVESPAMRMLLKKLEVDNYLALVAASSIIRPGVAKSGMMREYILRHRDKERIAQAHPVLLDIMPETYGIMVYQEDVIKVAHYFAGLSLGEADVLRRGMSGKYRSRDEFDKAKENFYANCIEKGYTPEVTKEVWRQVESFAGYAFAKGHSASYAVESYQSLYLKAHYPLEFMVAVINNFGGFYSTEHYIHEARMAGGTIHSPCINSSQIKTSIKGKDIYLGLMHVRGLESSSSKLIINERLKNGPFIDFDNFIDRVTIGREQVNLLVRVNAFQFSTHSSRRLLWESHFKTQVKVVSNQKRLFASTHKKFSIPQLEYTESERCFDQLELLGFPLESPFSLLLEPISHSLQSRHLQENNNRTITLHGYLVTTKNTATSKGDRMSFGTFVDQEGSFIDTVHFPDVAQRYPFRGKGVYRITGKVVEEFGFYSLEVQKMQKCAYIEDPRYS